jgi:hypothetical protein
MNPTVREKKLSRPVKRRSLEGMFKVRKDFFAGGRLGRRLGWVAMILLVGCASTPPNVAKIELTGTPGARVTGYYIQNGTREELKGQLPMTLYQPGVSQLAVRKEDPSADLEVRAKDSNGSGSASLPPGNDQALSLQLAGVPSFSVMAPEALLVPAAN